MSWNPDNGIQMFINNTLVVSSFEGSSIPDDEREYNPDADGFYLGRGSPAQPNRRFASMSVDDLQYWYGNRRYLLAFDYINRGKFTRY